MIKADREVLISFGALGALLVVCAGVVLFSLQARFDAAQEFEARSTLVSQLEARVRARNEARPKSGAVAPATAFLTAATQGLAGAQLQAHLQQMADAQHATIVSSGLEPIKHEERRDSIRLQATLVMNLSALQAMLYQLESGTPYVFVDSLKIQLPGTGPQRAVEDPLLRVTFELRAVWRRDNA